MTSAKKIKVKDLLSSKNVSAIPIDSIRIVDRPTSDKATKLFYNPRFQESFDPESMQELYESICKIGIQQFPVVRAIRDKKDPDFIDHFELIAGERRLRCLQKAYTENAKVYNDLDKKIVDAKKLFSNITCKILIDCDDYEALAVAFTENDKSKSLTIAEEISIVKHLDSQGLKEQEIADLLGTNITWVSQTLNFETELPKEAFKLLLDNQMTRNVVVKLMSFPEEKRQLVLERAKEVSKVRNTKKIEVAKKQVEEAVNQVEDAEVSSILAENATTKQKAEKKKQTAKSKLDKAKDNLKKTKSKSGKITTSDIESAVAGSSTEDQIRPKTDKMLSKSVIEENYVSKVEKWIMEGHLDSVTKEEFPIGDLEIVIAVATAILKGDSDPSKELRSLYISRGSWNLPDREDKKKKTDKFLNKELEELGLNEDFDEDDDNFGDD